MNYPSYVTIGDWDSHRVVLVEKENDKMETVIGTLDTDKLRTYLNEVLNEFPNSDGAEFVEKTIESIESFDQYSVDRINNLIVLNAMENVTQDSPEWTYITAQFFLHEMYLKASNRRQYEHTLKYGNFYQLVEELVELGIYHSGLIDMYSKAEIEELGQLIDPSKDNEFTYIGLRTLHDRYLKKDYDKQIMELPQERFMIIAMTLMRNEPREKRKALIQDAYWALSNLYMTVATPTLSNAGASYGQLSSCFIDTVDDSLTGIFNSNTDIATLSKGGGGIGVYLGKIRSRGSDIKGHKGVSSGVIPWMKQLNNTSVSVDQLGQRKGAISVYLDIWHKDILSFLDVKLNNGDERLRTHDLFTGVCIPDLFMEKVNEKDENGKSIGIWHLFDPQSIRRVKGWSLEDFYDEKLGAGTFREKYEELLHDPRIEKTEVKAIDIFKSIMVSQLETGAPFMFYRDQVNRLNSNKHKGMIYCTNLCTEITQNQSATTVDEIYTEDGKIVTVKTPGDFVVCNLSSINLGRAVPDDVLERLIRIQVRMLDNVIDINSIEVMQAQLTNQKYRAVGLGTFGWHHLLALKKIKWESEEAVQYSNELYEKIAYLTIKASVELAEEKGVYPVFEGSDWHTGAYFAQRGYDTPEWLSLKERASKGIRNGYLMAVAPNASTSIIAGSTASIDPIFRKEYSEEKKDYKIHVTVPDLNSETTWFYKSAYLIDQKWSILQNASRQKHIDQAISFNLYVRNDIKAKELLDLHMLAWKSGLKTTYYTRSLSGEYEECDSCAS